MTDEIRVHPKITDAVTQNNVQVVAEAPAMATGMLYQMAAQSSGISMQNAVNAQQGMNQISTAIIAKSVNTLLTVPEAPEITVTPDPIL